MTWIDATRCRTPMRASRPEIIGTTLSSTVRIANRSPNMSAMATAGSKPPTTGMSTISRAAGTAGSPKQVMKTPSAPPPTACRTASRMGGPASTSS